jgi:DNA-binding NarL/FixJ family response regulator
MIPLPAQAVRWETLLLPEEASQTDRLRLLLLGQELRIEALKALLTTQRDLHVLGLVPLTEPEQVGEIVDRIACTASPLDVIVLDGEGACEPDTPLLRLLSERGQRCLVLASWQEEAAVQRVQEAGAWGYCWTGASPLQVIQAIRRIAVGHPCFLAPPITTSPACSPPVQRRPVLCRERVQARAAEIGWQLNEVDLGLMTHLASSQTTQDLARQLGRRPGTVRTDLSSRLYLFLTLLSGRQKIPNRLTALHLLLELGLVEYH